MCGIAGFLSTGYTDSKITIIEVENMLNTIKYRGPDDRGICVLGDNNTIKEYSNEIYMNGNWKGIFGFNRLSIQDVSELGHQPMIRQDVVITFNGEIYNVKELRRNLLARGCKFRGHSDTEVIINLYIRYGFDEMIKMLNGMFAIVLYDNYKQKLYIARDRMGIIPIYFTWINNSLVWASEIKCFLEISSFERKLNFDAVSREFLYSFPDVPLFDGVKAIEPGSYYAYDINAGALNIIKYYDIANISKISMDDNGNIFEYFEYVMRKCIKRQLVSDVEVGVQFSGGVDSTLIAKYVSDCFLKKNKKLLGFSLVNPKSNVHNEQRWIRQAAEKIPIELNLTDMSDKTFLRDFEICTFHLEKFLNDPSPIGIYEFSKMAKNNVTVLLSGEGADELFGGYREFVRWKELEEQGLLEDNLYDFLSAFNRQVEVSQCKEILPVFSDKKIMEERYNAWKQMNGSCLKKERIMLFRSLLVGLLERQNKLCMANSIENRVPFLDNEMIELAFSVPDSYLIRYASYTSQMEGKDILKQVSSSIYGKEFAYRQKQYIRVPILEYFKNSSFMEYLNDLIIPKMDERGIINMTSFHKNYHMLTSHNVMMVWKAINFEVWCQLFLDKRNPIT